MNPADRDEIRHDASAGRYELSTGGSLAVLDYQHEGDRIVITHTFVPPALRGQGIAEKLTRRALDDARREKRKVVPSCSYAAAFIQRHAEYQPLLARE